jgi:hypothetical protein
MPHYERLFIQIGADANCQLIEAVHKRLDDPLGTNIILVRCIVRLMEANFRRAVEACAGPGACLRRYRSKPNVHRAGVRLDRRQNRSYLGICGVSSLDWQKMFG